MCRCECVCVSLATCPGCVPPLGRYMHLMEALCVFHSHTVDVVKHLWTWIVAFDRIAVSLNMAATILTWQSINLFSTLGFGTCDHVSLHNNRRVCMHQKQLSPACLFSCVESGRSSKAPLSIGSFDGLLLCGETETVLCMFILSPHKLSFHLFWKVLVDTIEPLSQTVSTLERA